MTVSLRKLSSALAALLLVIAVGIAGWDFLQLGRKIPELVSPESQADLIKVDKTARTLTLLRAGNAIKTYRVSLGVTPDGHKLREGDGRTPEGRYSIDSKNSRSRFHLALHISYPNAEDSQSAQQRGVPPGGDIMVHGLPNGLGWLHKFHLKRDWTDGCVAVTNQEMEEIWAHVATGTAIEVQP
jgi:murein L,D-transpeptidase YafK